MLTKNNVRWVYQNNLLADNTLMTIRESLDGLGVENEEVVVIPYSSTLPDFTLDNFSNVYYGSTTFMNLIYEKLNKPKGLFYNDITFSMENYIKQWGEHMLNSDARFTTVEEFLNEDNDPEENFFLRPDGDGKEFDGQVAQFKNAKIWFNRVMEYENTLTNNSKILVGPAYNIHKEWRNYIVDGEIVSSSLYRENFRLKKSGTDIPEDMLEFVRERIKEYQPHDCFAIDIASTHDGTYYIIECGCLNSVGFYDASVDDIFKAITKYMGKE